MYRKLNSNGFDESPVESPGYVAMHALVELTNIHKNKEDSVDKQRVLDLLL